MILRIIKINQYRPDFTYFYNLRAGSIIRDEVLEVVAFQVEGVQKKRDCKKR